MSFPRLFAEPQAILVADASAAINLNGTDMAAAILSAVPHSVLVTEEAIAELERGRKHGHDDADKVAVLVAQKRLTVKPLEGRARQIYEQLVSGPASETLDDGEAATIAYAIEVGGLALIDERKAITLCAAKHPSLEVVSTTALLLHHRIETALGSELRTKAILGALKNARMRVPTELYQTVVDLIGTDQAAQCPSLPRSIRLPV